MLLLENTKYRTVSLEQQYKTKLTLLWIYKEILREVKRLNKERYETNRYT